MTTTHSILVAKDDRVNAYSLERNSRIHRQYLAKKEMLQLLKITRRNVAKVKFWGHLINQSNRCEFLIAEERIQGYRLINMTRDNRVPIKSALYVALLVLETLHSLHRQGIFHEALVAENIILHDEGVYLTSTQIPNILKLIIGNSGGAIGFFPSDYAIPNDALLLGTRCYTEDIYRVGVLLYYMLSGRRPFASDLRTNPLFLGDENDMISLSSITNLDNRIIGIVQKAMHSNPKKRYQNVVEMHMDILSLKDYI